MGKRSAEYGDKKGGEEKTAKLIELIVLMNVDVNSFIGGELPLLSR